jgi:hypothetical protein
MTFDEYQWQGQDREQINDIIETKKEFPFISRCHPSTSQLGYPADRYNDFWNETM